MPVVINGTTGINSPGGTFTGAVTTNGFSNSMSSFNQLVTQVSNDNQVGVKIARTGGTNITSWEIYNASGDTNKSLRFYETLDRMILDASGRLTLPYQPAFSAYGSGGTFGNGFYQNYTANSTFFNRGNHYNTSTSRFTAPVAGVYQFDASIMVSSGTGRFGVGFNTSGGSVFGSFFYVTGGDTGGSTSALIYMNAGDWVAPQISNLTGGNATVNGDSRFSFFAGFLVG